MDLHGDGGASRDGHHPDGLDGTPLAGQQADQVLADALIDARSGDERAIAVVYRQLNPRLVRYLRHHVGDLAHDLASEVWLALARELHRCDANPSGFRALMFTIAHRRVVDQYRRAKRQPTTVPIQDAGEWAGSEDPAELAVDGMETERAVRMLASELPPEQAEIVLLRVLGDLDVAQVADILGKTPGAVRVAQHRAVRRLQRRWERSTVTR